MPGDGSGAKEMTDSDILRWAHQFLDAILPVVPAEVVPSEVVQA